MEIWIGRNGERNGPYKEADVRQWLRSGQLGGEDLGWYEGLADWQPLSVLFRDEVASAPATPPPMSAETLPQTTTATLEDYAGFWKRVAAFLLDSVVLYLPNTLILKAMGGDAAQAKLTQAITSATGDPHAMLAAYGDFYSSMGVASLITGVLAWLYFAYCESSPWQATVGKLALGIRVTDLQGQRISFPRALGRYPAKILSYLILCIGFVMVAWTQRKQALHDMIAGTLVLNGRAGDFKGKPAERSTPGGSFDA